MNELIDNEYKNWIKEIKAKIRTTQLKAAVAVNSSLIEFYWDLGKMIAEKQTAWGAKLIEQVAKDLHDEFPLMEGFSTSNLKYCRRFYLFYQSLIGQQAVDQFTQQAVAQIPWGHNILIFTKSKSINEANFYIQQTIKNGWSRDILSLQIKNQPMGISEYQLTKLFPSDFESSLPTIEEIETQLQNDEQ